MLHRPLMVLFPTLCVVCAQEVIQLEKIEVRESVQTLEERKEHSIAKRIITGEELTQYGDINALEILKRTPGVSIAEGKNKKGSPGKGYTVVLIDGEEATTGSKRRASPLEQISPDMIERIEVMSNGSAEYTAEAMGGIVNIVLKKPKSDGKTIAKVSVGAYGNIPNETLFVQREGKEGNWSHLINLNVLENRKNDTASTFIHDISSYTNELREEETRSRMVNLTGKVFYTPTSKVKYSFDASVAWMDDQSTTEEQTATESSTLSRMLYDNGDSSGVMVWSKLTGEYHLSGTELVEWKLKFHQNNQAGESSSVQTFPTFGVKKEEDESLFRVMGAEGVYSRAFENHFLKTGVELKRMSQQDEVHRSVNGTDVTVLSDNVTLRDDKGSLYIQDEITWGESAILTPGLRYENVSREYGISSNIDYFAPSLHLLYKLSAQDNLRASVAKTIKLPRLNELSLSVDSTLDQNDLNHPDVTGNPNLKEEEALSYELRYEHYFDDKGIASIGGFYRNINDKIEKLTTLESGRYVERPYNAGEGELWGIELELKKSLNTLAEGLGMFANATIQDSSLSSNGFTRPIKQTNDYLYNVGIDHTLSAYRLTYGAAYRYVGGYNDPVDESGVSESLKGYGTLDLYASKRLDSTYKLAVNLKNITSSAIRTSTQRFDSAGSLIQSQYDIEDSKPQILLTLEGKW